MKKLLALATLLIATASLSAQADAAKLALARAAISAMQVDKMFDAMIPQMKQMANQMAHLPAETSPEAKLKIEAFQSKVMDLAVGEMKTMLTQMDAVYANVYSEAELKAMIAFFTSPEGTSMQAKQPQVMAQMMPMIQQMQQGLMAKTQQLAAEFQKEIGSLQIPPAPAAK